MLGFAEAAHSPGNAKKPISPARIFLILLFIIIVPYLQWTAVAMATSNPLFYCPTQQSFIRRALQL